MSNRQRILFVALEAVDLRRILQQAVDRAGFLPRRFRQALCRPSRRRRQAERVFAIQQRVYQHLHSRRLARARSASEHAELAAERLLRRMPLFLRQLNLAFLAEAPQEGPPVRLAMFFDDRAFALRQRHQTLRHAGLGAMKAA